METHSKPSIILWYILRKESDMFDPNRETGEVFASHLQTGALFEGNTVTSHRNWTIFQPTADCRKIGPHCHQLNLLFKSRKFIFWTLHDICIDISQIYANLETLKTKYTYMQTSMDENRYIFDLNLQALDAPISIRMLWHHSECTNL